MEFWGARFTVRCLFVDLGDLHADARKGMMGMSTGGVAWP